jgi:holo-[acyl-carrier protein] synthase
MSVVGGPIRGVGTDLVTIARIAQVLERHGERFQRRILHPGELARQRDSDAAMLARSLAKSFAAKEAVAKALGTGFRNGVSWVDIEIDRDELGKPIVRLHGAALARAKSLGGGQLWLSLSDEQEQVLAFAVLAASA